MPQYLQSLGKKNSGRHGGPLNGFGSDGPHGLLASAFDHAASRFCGTEVAKCHFTLRERLIEVDFPTQAKKAFHGSRNAVLGVLDAISE
jgi:hypothetical protein